MHEKNVDIVGISLIICAKNEYENLQKYLGLWLEQEGIAFELILVNDRSTDNSIHFLEELAVKHSQLKIVNLDKDFHSPLQGKRAALYEGVQAATYDYLVLSDADCYPSSKQHLVEMANAFQANTEIVLGYAPYNTSSGLLGQMVTYETSLTALQYLSFAKIACPYMGVGRNLAYKKSVLTKEVFMASNTTQGGDDDLMVALIANKNNTAVQLHPASHVYSDAPADWTSYFKQKQRHYSTARQYGWMKIITVGGFGALNILFYIAMFTLLLMQVKLFLVLSLYLCKLLMFTLLNYRNLKLMGVAKMVKSIVYLDFIFTFIFLINHLKALKGKHGWS